MSNKKDDGGPAFPVAENHEIAAQFPWTAGMSYHDVAALMAMQVLIKGMSTDPDKVAVISHVYADAMLAERKRRAEQ